MPCGGPDAESSDPLAPPHWARQVKVSEIVPDIKYGKIKALRKRCEYTITGGQFANQDWVYVQPGTFDEGDFLVVWGQIYEVKAMFPNFQPTSVEKSTEFVWTVKLSKDSREKSSIL